MRASLQAMTSTDRLRRLPPLRKGHPPTADMIAARTDTVEPASAISAVRVERLTMGGVPCFVCEPPEVAATFLYFHGGGYWRGRPAMWTSLASRVALRARARVILPDYSLAPERPFPAAVHDATNVYLSLEPSSNDIFAGGESAGGGLAASLALAIRRCDLPPLAGVALVSPWLDLTLEAKSYSVNAARDKVFGQEAAQRYAAWYLQGHDSTDELVSPLHSDPTGFPPTLLMVGTEEVLLDDSLEFARRLAVARSSVELHVMVGMQHAWPIVQQDIAETEFAIERISAHIEHAQRRASPEIRPIIL